MGRARSTSRASSLGRGGNQSGTGITNPNGGLTLSGSSNKVLTGRTLNNPGTSTMTGSGGFFIGSSAVFNNNGTFDLQADADINATGAGAVANPLSHTLTTPQVTIGGVPANVLFSGLAPNFVGLYVVTLQVPAGAPTGHSVPVVLTIGGIQSNTVTVAVE